MRRKWEALVRASALAVVVMAASTALGGPDPAKLKSASDSFAAGAQAYKARSFEEAAAHFEAADNAVPSAKALRLAIRSRDEAGQSSRAATLAAYALEKYAGDTETKQLADEILAKHKGKLHRVEVSCVSPCLLAVGPRIVHGPAATRWTVYVDPGKVVVGASLLGKIVAPDQTVDAREGTTSAIRFEPPKSGAEPAGPVVAAAPTSQPARSEAATSSTSGAPKATDPGDASAPSGTRPSSESSGLSPWFFYAGAAVTAGLAGATVWSGIDTTESPGVEAVRAGCAGQGEECPLYAEGQANEVRTNALLGATVGAAAITVAIAFFSDFGGEGDAEGASTKSGLAPSLEPWIGVDVANERGPTGQPSSGFVLGARGEF
jgi:hypothetical protein